MYYIILTNSWNSNYKRGKGIGLHSTCKDQLGKKNIHTLYSRNETGYSWKNMMYIVKAGITSSKDNYVHGKAHESLKNETCNADLDNQLFIPQWT